MPFATTANFQFANGELRVGEMWLEPGTYDGLSWAIAAGGSTGSVSRALVYADDGTGKPAALLLDSGTVDSTTIGTKTVTGLSLVVPAGGQRVHAGVVSQGNPTTRPSVTYANASPRGSVTGTSPSPSSLLPSSWNNAAVTGTPPSTLAGTITRSNSFPVVAFRRSA